MHRLSYGPSRYIFEASGLQSIARPPAKPGTVPRVVFLTPAIAQASAILAGDKLVRFDLDLMEPQAKDATQGADPKRTAVADRAQLHLLARPDNSIDVAFKVNNAKIAGGFAGGAADIELPLIDLRARLTHADTLDPLRAGMLSVADAAAAWRAAMGAVAVSDLALTLSDAHADLKGDLALDDSDGLTGALKGDGVTDGKTPAMFSLNFAKGEMRLNSASASPGAGSASGH
jgi:hypothetical protein